MIIIKCEFVAGSSFNECVEHAYDFAVKNQVIVDCEFNKIKFYVSPTTEVKYVINAFEKDLTIDLNNGHRLLRI